MGCGVDFAVACRDGKTRLILGAKAGTGDFACPLRGMGVGKYIWQISGK